MYTRTFALKTRSLCAAAIGQQFQFIKYIAVNCSDMASATYSILHCWQLPQILKVTHFAIRIHRNYSELILFCDNQCICYMAKSKFLFFPDFFFAVCQKRPLYVSLLSFRAVPACN